MWGIFTNGVSGLVLRGVLRDAVTGDAKTGLTFSSEGLRIGTIADNEETSTAYTGGNLQTIAHIGAWTSPGTKAGFKQVDATNHPGLYEIHLPAARWSVSGARYLNVTIAAADVFTEHALVQLPLAFDPDDARLGLAGIDTITDLLEANRVIDTSVAPWALVLIKQGSGALGEPGAVELLRQNLYDVAGGAVNSINTILGRSIT